MINVYYPSKNLNKRNKYLWKRIKSALPCLTLVSFLLAACRNDMEKVRMFDRHSIPQQAIDSVSVMRSNFGERQMTLKAPFVLVLDNPERMTVFPQGFNMNIYGDHGNSIVADITADSATSLDDRKIIKAHHNVVIIDYRSGDTTYLDSIVWESATHTIYSRAPVKSVNGPRITYGDGFESDEDFTSPIIYHQRGTMTINE